MRRKRTDMIVIHCSATPFGKDYTAADIDEMHVKKGWAGIGYAQVIQRNGLIEFGRHYDDQGAHVKGYNGRSVGVCLIGGLVEGGEAGDQFFDTFTEDQEESLIETIEFLKLAYPEADILGHRDLSPDLDGDGIVEEDEWLKECPTFDVDDWLQEHEL